MPFLAIICSLLIIFSILFFGGDAVANFGWWSAGIILFLIILKCYSIKTKENKVKSIVVETNKKHSTSFTEDFGVCNEELGFFVDIKSNKVLVVDGDYVHLGKASFIKSYGGTRKGEGPFVKAKFQLDDTSHHHFEISVHEDKYDKITMTLESMWSNSQNTENETASA